MHVIGIDPGEKHCGVAHFYSANGRWGAPTTYTFDQSDLFGHLMNGRAVDQVVMEEYRLYPWLLQQQGFSAVTTIEAIGVVKHICKARRWPLVMQSATCKKPAAGLMRKRSIALVGRNQHEKDAVMHGYYWILKEDKWESSR